VLLLRSASSNLIHRLLDGVGMDWKELRLLLVEVLLREGTARGPAACREQTRRAGGQPPSAFHHRKRWNQNQSLALVLTVFKSLSSTIQHSYEIRTESLVRIEYSRLFKGRLPANQQVQVMDHDRIQQRVMVEYKT
jgi:hypothetical protein